MKNKGENHTLFSLKIHIFAVFKLNRGAMPLTLRRRFLCPYISDKSKVFIKILRRVVEWKHPRSFAIKA